MAATATASDFRASPRDWVQSPAWDLFWMFSAVWGTALLLGTSQWLIADGRLIRKQGIEPDVAVELPVGADLVSPEDLEELTVAELLSSEDQQILRALELLGATPQASLGAGGEHWQEINIVK